MCERTSPVPSVGSWDNGQGTGQGSLMTNFLIPVLSGHEGCKGDGDIQHKRDSVKATESWF